jgi:hypothetical protein
MTTTRIPIPWFIFWTIGLVGFIKIRINNH